MSSTQTQEVSSVDIALLASRAAINKRGEKVMVIDLQGLSSFTDTFVIASAASDRQVQSICDEVIHDLGEIGLSPIGTDGFTDGRWVVIDFGRVVIHVFLDAIRDYYDLETLWKDAPRVKIPGEFYGVPASRAN